MKLTTLYPFAAIAAVGVAAESLRGKRSLDSICGPGKRYIAALNCNNATIEHCAPNMEKGVICDQTWHSHWAEAKCKHFGGFDSVDRLRTGCRPCGDDCDSFCDGAPHSPAPLSQLENGGFEDNSFDHWETEGGVTIIHSPSNAPEGEFYASLKAGCYITRLERTGVVVGMGQAADEFCPLLHPHFSFKAQFDAKDYLPYDDCMILTVSDSMGNVIYEDAYCVHDVGNNGDTDWMDIDVDLGFVALEETLSFHFKADSVNTLDCGFDSYVFIDAAKLWYEN